MDELEERLRSEIQRRGTVENAEPAERRALSVAENTLTHAVIGAAIEVHRQLGPGFLEAVYEQAFALELEARSIKLRR